MKATRRGPLAMLLVALIAAGVGISVDAAHWFRGAELGSVDTRFSVRGDQGADPNVVLVAMDDATLKAAGRYPLDRRSHARVIRALTKAGAAVIVEDVQFTEASDNAASDESLFAAVSDAPRIVLSTTEVRSDGGTEIFGGGEALAESGAVPAWSGMPPDGGKIRRFQLRLNGLDSVALAAAKLKLGAKARLPKDGRRWIDFRGPDGTYDRLSFKDVEQGSFPASAVRGKVVVIGATAAKLQDYHPTTVDGSMAGPEIQANAISTALDDFPLNEAAGWINLLVILVLAVIPSLVARRLGTIPAVIASLVTIAAFLGLAQLAFNNGVILEVIAPLATAVTALVLTPAIAAPSRVPLAHLMERLGPPGANRRTRRVLASALLGCSLAVIAITLVLQAANGLQRLELSSVNQRFAIRGSQGQPSNIVLVAIDDYTFTRPPKPTWPFDRRDHADVIRNLTKAGAKVIAYDVQFTEAGPSLKADNDLADAVEANNGHIVLATTEVRPDGTTEIFGGGEALASTKAVPAWSGFPNDPDGKIRHLQRTQGGLESFDLAAARLYTGRVVKAPDYLNWIDFQGSPGTVKTLSFVNVKENKFKPSDVKGKVVVVGSTSNVLQDFHPTSTSTDEPMPGPEIHVAGIRTALEGFPLQDAPNWLNVLLVVVLALLAPLAGLRLRVLPALLIGAVGLIAFAVGSQLLFQHAGWINHVVYPFVAGIAAMLCTGVIHGLTTAFEREQARDAFARFVPEAVVDQVLTEADGVRLGGVRGEATVMFSYLRGFTSFSETLEPEVVIDSLNRYLTLMSEAILDHGGTLVAYMGDGIMAVFGAPLKQEDHADRALEAARDMLSKMEEFNAFLRGAELNDGFKMGIGLNSGPVMSGNVGSERRLEYTALGDTTNTAARLEGMTKGTPHQLFLSDTTKQALTRPVSDLVQVGEAEVRGRAAKVLLWSIRDEEPSAPAEAAPERVEA